MKKSTENYFGIGKGSGIVPADANTLGFIIVNNRYKRTRNDKIPFQYLEKMPSWQREANYEETQIPGRFETLSSYSNTGAGQLELSLFYIAEATYPKPIDQKTLERELKSDIKSYYKKKEKQAVQDFQENKLTINGAVQKFSRESDAYARQRIDQYLQTIYNPKGPPKTPWTIEYIESLILKLKSLVFPQYDGRFTPPNKVLFNAGDLFVDYPVIIKTITVDHEGPFLIRNMMPIIYKVTLSCITNYPLYQAISGSSIYAGREGNRVFAQKRFNARDSSMVSSGGV